VNRISESIHGVERDAVLVEARGGRSLPGLGCWSQDAPVPPALARAGGTGVEPVDPVSGRA